MAGQEADALERRVRALEWLKLQSAPGQRFEYANDGFNTAGLIVQTVSGMPFEQYIAEKILKPLKMTRSTFDPARAAELGLAQGYLKRKGELRPEKTRLTKAYNPSGMLLTSAEDAGRSWQPWRTAAPGRRPRRQPDSLDQMCAPAARVGDNLEYGLGWFLSQQEGLRAVVHPGEILTMGSMFVLLPERKLGVAVLANLDNDGKDEIAEGVARLLIGLEPVLRRCRGSARRTRSCRIGRSGIGTSASTRRHRARSGSSARATSWPARSCRSASSWSRSRTRSS